jgi:hypothetical protein
MQVVNIAIIRAGRCVLVNQYRLWSICAVYDVYHATKKSSICRYPVTEGGTLENAARYVPVHVS